MGGPRWRRERLEYVAALGAVGGAVLLAFLHGWPFEEVPLGDEPSLLEVLLYDRVVLGFVRLSIVVLTCYGIASVPALVTGGRWATTLGTGGVVAGSVRNHADSGLAEAERRVAALELENAGLLGNYEDVMTLLEDETAPD